MPTASQSAATVCRQRAADDEPEVARPGGRDGSGIEGVGQHGHSLARVGGVRRQRPPDQRSQLIHTDPGVDPPLAHVALVFAYAIGDEGKQWVRHVTSRMA